jgi:hypothetical protein
LRADVGVHGERLHQHSTAEQPATQPEAAWLPRRAELETDRLDRGPAQAYLPHRWRGHDPLRPVEYDHGQGNGKLSAGQRADVHGEDVGTARTKLTHRWLDRVTSAANRDPVVNAAFFQVTGLLAKPASLFRPAVAWRTLRFGQPTQTTIPASPTTSPASH